MEKFIIVVKSGIGKNGKQWYAVDMVTPTLFRKRFFLNAWQLKQFGFEEGKVYSFCDVTDPVSNND